MTLKRCLYAKKTIAESENRSLKVYLEFITFSTALDLSPDPGLMSQLHLLEPLFN
jgi:hypothetical protein